MSSPAGGETYRDAGVDLDAAESLARRLGPLAAATHRPEVVGGLGGFAGLFALDRDRWREPLLVSSTDGVGTKAEIARQARRYDTIGIDLVAMCVDDVVCTGAEPLFLLDYLAVGRLDTEVVAALVAGVAEGCRQAGCALVGGETAEHPGVLAPDQFDLAGFTVGAVERDGVLGPHRVRAGDVLVGLPSPNLRSNGFSLVRRILLDRDGRDLASEAWPGAGRDLADVLLEPSVIYTPAVLAAVRAAAGAVEGSGGVRAAAHVTGGGLPGNLPRVLGPDLGARVRWGSWELPRVMRELAAAGPVERHELVRVFNAGVGFVLVVDPEAVSVVRDALVGAGHEPFVLGEVVPGRGEVAFAEGL